MSNHDSNGRFTKGNNAARIPRVVKEFKAHCKEDLYQAIESLREPMGNLKAKLEKGDVTKWQYIVAKAISKGDTRFIQWLYEMVLGRPSQSVEVGNENNNFNFTIEKIDGSKEVMKVE